MKTSVNIAPALATRGKRQRWQALVVWLAVSLLVYVVPAAAQTPTIVLDVHAGYDGTFRIGEWFPIQVQIANDGPDIRGVLSWSLPGQPDENIFQRTVDLPRGARKQLTLYAYAHNFARNGKMQLLDGPNVLAEQDTRLEAADSNQFLVGVLSSDPALLNSLSSLQLPGGVTTSVLHMSLATLPDQASALRGLNALFVHDLDTSTLSQAQRQAIALWVQGGGKLVASGGPDSARLTAGIADLLPATIGTAIAQHDLAQLARLASQPTTDTTPNATAIPSTTAPVTTTVILSSPGAAPLNTVTPRTGAQTLPSNDTPLIVQRTLGNGDITLSTFDLALLRGWVGEAPLWQRLLATETSLTNTRSQAIHTDLLQQVLRLPSLGLLSVRLLVALLLGYVLAIGPLNYLVLRRLGRLEWAWLSVPLTVLIFAIGFYIVGFRLRGRTYQVHQVAVVQAAEGQPRAAATAFIGLFSPQRASYNLGFQPDALVNETRSVSDSFNDIAIVQSTDTDVHVSDLLVDVSSVRSLTIETALDAPVRVESRLQITSTSVGGEIRNAGSTPLEDAIIVQDGRYQALGTLAPGASQAVTLNGSSNFPWGLTTSPVGVFDRQELLSTLFSSNNNVQQLLDKGGVYMLAWSNSPSISMQLNTQDSGQDGITLYIVRLNGT